MPSTDAERAFVEALLRGVVALEQYAEEAVEVAQKALGAAGDPSGADLFYGGVESAYVEAGCLAQLRTALEGQIGRAALTQALSAALSQIERNFGKGSIMRLGENSAIEVESISTGSLSCQ